MVKQSSITTSWAALRAAYWLLYVMYCVETVYGASPAGYLCRAESGCRSESCCSATPRPLCRCRCLLLPPGQMATDLHTKSQSQTIRMKVQAKSDKVPAYKQQQQQQQHGAVCVIWHMAQLKLALSCWHHRCTCKTKWACEPTFIWLW